MITLPIVLVTLWANGFATFWGQFHNGTCEELAIFMLTQPTVIKSDCMPLNDAKIIHQLMKKNLLQGQSI